MFPLRDDNPTFRTPVVMYALIALNVASWFWLQGAGLSDALRTSICEFGLIPYELLNSGSALGMFDSANQPAAAALVCPTHTGARLFTVFTSMFMHGGWMHIIGNMWFLYVFGDNVEDSMGRGRFALFYLLCGLGAAGLQIYFDASSFIPMVGASGAIGGVMGAYIILYPRVRIHMLVTFGFFWTRVVVPAYLMLGIWFLVQLVGGLPQLGSSQGGVAFWAHVGGFVAGAILIFFFKNPELVAKHRRGSQYIGRSSYRGRPPYEQRW